MSTPDPAYAFGLSPDDAKRYFEGKGLRLTRSWNELLEGAHTTVHTVAHLGKLDLLQRVYIELQTALKEGLTEREFVERLTPVLQTAGWWGRAIDPDTGKVLETYPGSNRAVQYGSPARLSLIYRQNLQTAYMAGRHHTLQAATLSHPYWQYIAIKDSRTRPAHAALHGRVYRHDDPIWKTLYPPNGWHCRCQVRPLSAARLKRENLTAEQSENQRVDADLPAGHYPDGKPKTAHVTGIRTGQYDADGQEIILFPDAGWSYNPGASWQTAQQQHLALTLEHLAAHTPPSLLVRLKAFIRNTFNPPAITAQSILKISQTTALDPELLADTAAIATTNHYINALNATVFSSIAQGGIKGNAALQHEREEVAALTRMGRNVQDTTTLELIRQEFKRAEAIFDSNAHDLWNIIPYHLQALMAELRYLQAKLKDQGIIEEDLGMIASALYYSDEPTEAQNKTSTELLAMGLKWYAHPPATLLAALQGTA